MASRRFRLITISAALATLAGGYGLYLTAQTAPPELAQAPMNITNTVPPAFIMAVDDSGSMTFETLFPGRDGYGCTGTGTSNPYFNSDGTLRTEDGDGNGGTYSCNFHHIFPYPGHRIGTNRYAIAPIDLFGFARSNAYNPAYFDPNTTYSPWMNHNKVEYPAASLTETLTDPRNASGPKFNMTALHRDRIDDADPGNSDVGSATYNSGTFFPAGIQYARNGACGGLASTGGATTYVTLASDTTLNANCSNIRLRRSQAGQPETTELFRIPSGTTLPAGTVYYRLADSACGGLAAAAPTQRFWVRLPSAVTLSATCEVAIQYFPATFYMPLTDAAPAGYKTANRVQVANAGGPGVDLYRYEIKLDNYDTSAQYDAAIQNFANWFTYYGDRNRAMIAGMTRSLIDVENMRIGYFTINSGARNCGSNCTAYDAYTDVTMRDMGVAADKQALYTSMIALPASGSTPNRWAVEHIGKQFQRTNTGAPVTLSCQKNAGMLFTDGYSNQGGPAVANADGDGGMGTPFSDSHDNTMADIASYYYRNNIRPDLTEGGVKVDKACPAAGGDATDKSLDCNRNLHMNFYGITLGARGDLFDPEADPAQDAYTTASVYNNWPARQNDERSTVDDIWHAATNTRGEFINARTPSDITAAMRRIIAAVNEGESPAGTISVTGARVGSGSLNVQPFYESANNGTDWYSLLTAETVSADPFTGETTFTPAWEASARMAAQASREIYFGRTTDSVQPEVLEFSSTNVSLDNLCAGALSRCTAAEIEALSANGTNPPPAAIDAARAVAYLRGSRVDEGVLRTRTSILGDIINSTPVFSAPTDDYGYRTLGGTVGSSYATYLEAKRTANRPMVYVGANDGMFHMFDGRSNGSGGSEVFAYVPATALGHMGNLLFPYVAANQSDQKFQHRYFVDGPVTVSDVQFGTQWKTVVVGTTGAGGRSVFAMDVTTPGSPQVLWEINDLITGDDAISDNIGHVLGKPVIVPIKDTSGNVSWKVLFGNGYNSVNQQAHLFMVDVESGDVETIEASEATAPAYNGLGNIVVVDRRSIGSTGTVFNGRDGYADYVYAADQNGAVWKFNLLTSSVEFSGEPLFIARDSTGTNRQPIMGGLTAATGPGGGVMLFFGTGSFSFTGDPDNTSVQTIYGILDKGTRVTGRDDLVQQTVGTDDGEFRTTSSNAMGPGKYGWYLDLPAGERFVGYPRVESGIVFFPTYEPQGGDDSDDCGVTGTNWLYGLNALSGGASMTYIRMGTPDGSQPASATGAVALNTGGSAPVKDVAVMTTPRVQPLGTATQAQIDQALGAQCSMVIRVAGAPPMYLPRPCGRQSWRQVR
ncbi:pilus assembly protein [Pseudoxanthomonas daejeonensis]|uniref:pilus assembly protein n=1 Tax=Pseudoxanthomonas daejeonensis TaxID=266062 RepID=UPI001F5431D8|nr:PilC/PilY family type IV pilus protein [Pseudoxanthomonas daejeonensis]UNK56711.1 pilus assembly protein [Pseudoxanthomonas daejeonensis]